MRSKSRTDEEWLNIIQECRSSGYSDRTWCEQNNISINTFYNTVSKLRKKSCIIPESVSVSADTHEIVPLSLIDEEHIPLKETTQTSDFYTEKAALIITINGCSVSINNNACRDVIFHTLSALQQL